MTVNGILGFQRERRTESETAEKRERERESRNGGQPPAAEKRGQEGRFGEKG